MLRKLAQGQAKSWGHPFVSQRLSPRASWQFGSWPRMVSGSFPEPGGCSGPSVPHTPAVQLGWEQLSFFLECSSQGLTGYNPANLYHP